MRIFFSAGEASGDAYAAELVRALRGVAPTGSSLRFEGVGGRKLQSCGADLVADSSRWGAIGILQAFVVGPRVLRGFLVAKQALAQGDPGVFVPIDFGFMNVRLAAAAKACGWKVLYFIPPGSWRKTKQGADLPAVTDLIVTPFPWSAEILRGMGADARCFGHPLKEMVDRTPASTERKGLAVLPGSRIHEVVNNLPAIAQAVRELNVPLEFAVAGNLNAAKLERVWQRCSDLPASFTEGDAYGVLKRARAAAVCSGTATLEAALCSCPCVVVYRGSLSMQVEYRIRKPKFDYISLPNILLDRPAVPELIDVQATPQAIRRHLSALLADGPERQAQLDAFAELDAMLGAPSCLPQTAQLLLELSQTVPPTPEPGTAGPGS